MAYELLPKKRSAGIPGKRIGFDARALRLLISSELFDALDGDSALVFLDEKRRRLAIRPAKPDEILYSRKKRKATGARSGFVAASGIYNRLGTPSTTVWVEAEWDQGKGLWECSIPEFTSNGK